MSLLSHKNSYLANKRFKNFCFHVIATDILYITQYAFKSGNVMTIISAQLGVLKWHSERALREFLHCHGSANVAHPPILYESVDDGRLQ